jgi:hypothetical protein
VGILAFDHCHKPAAKVRTADGGRAFDALATFMTSTAQVALVTQTNSTQLQEVAPNIIELDERCKLNLTFPGVHPWDEAANTSQPGTDQATAVVIDDDSLNYTDADHSEFVSRLQAEAAAAAVAAGAPAPAPADQTGGTTGAAAAAQGPAAHAGGSGSSMPQGVNAGSSSSSRGRQPPVPNQQRTHGRSSSGHDDQQSSYYRTPNSYGSASDAALAEPPWQASSNRSAGAAAAAFAAANTAARDTVQPDRGVPVSTAFCRLQFCQWCHVFLLHSRLRHVARPQTVQDM